MPEHARARWYHHLQAYERPRPAASPLSPQKDLGCHEARSTTLGMESGPPLEHATRFSRGGLRRRCPQTPLGRQEPADDGEARLHDIAPLVGRLPLGEEGAVAKLKSCRLLRDVDVDRRALKTAAIVSARCPASIPLLLRPLPNRFRLAGNKLVEALLMRVAGRILPRR
jgi:hypothetical protein